MDAKFFNEWFNEQIVPHVKKFLKKYGFPQKTVLLMDNPRSHPSKEDMKNGDIQ